MKRQILRNSKTSQSFNAHTPIVSKIHKALTILNKTLRIIRNSTPQQYIIEINKNISRINELTETDINQTNISDLTNDLSLTIQNLEAYRKSLYTARQIKNNNALRDKIQEHIQNRYDNFKSSTTKMIDSILYRHIDYM